MIFIIINDLLHESNIHTKRLNNQLINLRNEKFKAETKYNLLKSIVAKAVQMDKEKSLKKSLSSASESIRDTESHDLDGDAHSLLESYMKDEDLDSDFVKAQLDSAILRSIVNPLELELDELRKKVKVYEYQLNITNELKKFSKNTGVEQCNVESLLKKYRVDEKNQDSYDFEKVVNILRDMATCMNEKHDFHIYATALLNSNENITDENDALKKTIKKLRAEVNIEKEKYHELQNTWRKANETFVEQSITMTKQLDELRQQVHIAKKQSYSEFNLRLSSSPTSLTTRLETNNESENIIQNLEHEKQKLITKLSVLRDENTNLHDAIIRYKATISDLTTHINSANGKLHEMNEKYRGDYERLEAILFNIENAIPGYSKMNDRHSFTQEFLDPLGASNMLNNDKSSSNSTHQVYPNISIPDAKSQPTIINNTSINSCFANKITSISLNNFDSFSSDYPLISNNLLLETNLATPNNYPNANNSEIMSNSNNDLYDLLSDFTSKVSTDDSKLNADKYSNDSKPSI